MLGFLDRHSEGAYLFEGTAIDDYSEDELAHIRNEKMGFIFQTFNLLPRADIVENVKLPLFYSTTPESEWDKLTSDAIEAVGLTHRKDHTPAQLSGGERQRVAILRSLNRKASVYVFDEAFSSQDAATGTGQRRPR